MDLVEVVAGSGQSLADVDSSRQRTGNGDHRRNEYCDGRPVQPARAVYQPRPSPRNLDGYSEPDATF
jgi:hypothetical protein